MDVKLKVFKKDENKIFGLAQNLTLGETDFIQFKRLRNQLVVAVKDFSKEENVTTVQAKLLSKDLEEQLKLTHKVLEVVDRPHRKNCVTMLRYMVEKPETSYVQVRLFGRRKEEENFNQIVHVNYKLGKLNYLLDVLNSAFDKVIAYEILCNIFVTINCDLLLFTIIFLISESERVRTLEKTETFCLNWSQNWDFIMLY